MERATEQKSSAVIRRSERFTFVSSGV